MTPCNGVVMLELAKHLKEGLALFGSHRIGLHQIRLPRHITLCPPTVRKL
jgi:hypothetical protein